MDEINDKMNKSIAPIILFVYNRPEHTRKTVEALQKNELASESILYVFADGAKPESTEEQLARIKEVRDYTGSITGFKEIHVEYSEKNKGLANSVIAGVTKIINEYGRVIVVEDDIVTHPFFLRYMNDALDFYEKNESVFSVGSLMYNINIPQDYNHDMILISRVESWGWATWGDRWKKCNWDISTYPIIKNPTPEDIKMMCVGGEDLWEMLKKQAKREIDSWAVRWQYNMMLQKGLCVRPRKSFASNVGFDGSGIHCEKTERSQIITPLYDNPIYQIHFEQDLREDNRILKSLQKAQAVHYEEHQLQGLYESFRHYIHIARLRLWKIIGLD